VRGVEVIVPGGRLLKEGRHGRLLLDRICGAVCGRRGGQGARPWYSPRPTPEFGSGMGRRGPNAVRGLCPFRDTDSVFIMGAEGIIENPS